MNKNPENWQCVIVDGPLVDPPQFQIFLRPCKEENGISEQQAQYARKSTKPNHEIKPFPLLFFSWKSTCCGGQWMLVSSPLLFLICWRPSLPDYWIIWKSKVIAKVGSAEEPRSEPLVPSICWTIFAKRSWRFWAQKLENVWLFVQCLKSQTFSDSCAKNRHDLLAKTVQHFYGTYCGELCCSRPAALVQNYYHCWKWLSDALTWMCYLVHRDKEQIRGKHTMHSWEKCQKVSVKNAVFHAGAKFKFFIGIGILKVLFVGISATKMWIL